MSFKNRKCKTCGKEYHHCSSCGYEGEWYSPYDYCSEKCAEKDVDHNKLRETIIKFIESLTEKNQKSTFMDIMESDSDEVDHIINNELKGRMGIEAWGLW